MTEINGFVNFHPRSRSRRAGYLTNAFVTFVKRKQKNLPTQIGLDVFQSHLNARPFGCRVKIFKASRLRVSAYRGDESDHNTGSVVDAGRDHERGKQKECRVKNVE